MEKELHKYRNLAQAYAVGNPYWDNAYENGLIEIRVNTDENGIEHTDEGKTFINLCSCSYLGLNIHPHILKRSHEILDDCHMIVYPTSRCRIANKYLVQAEESLGELFNAKVMLTVSCAAATLGVLPVIASGVLGNKPDIMVFDKHAHFSLAFVKPICGDETEVSVIKHNDMEALEEICKKYKSVMYVADGAYSMGGITPIEKLLELHSKYGLQLYFDDSHSLSVVGKHGEGFVRNAIKGDLPPGIFIVSSLGKAFGASGGVIMFNEIYKKTLFDRFGGPMSWSQSVNHAGIGAILGSIDIHKSPELKERQDKLRKNLEFFDSNIPTEEAGNETPIRLVPFADPDKAVEAAKYMFDNGFYTSAVFFPIIEKGKGGLRIMPRADLKQEDMEKIIKLIKFTQNEK